MELEFNCTLKKRILQVLFFRAVSHGHTFRPTDRGALPCVVRHEFASSRKKSWIFFHGNIFGFFFMLYLVQHLGGRLAWEKPRNKYLFSWQSR